MNQSASQKSWFSAFKSYADRRAWIMLFLGFSAGIPILLIFSTLGLWLGEAGIERSAITFFSWAALGYSFKFIWAPLIDELPIPVLTQKLGRRRAWLLISQILIVFAICIMAMTDPALGGEQLYQMAFGAVLLGFSSATQDVVIDAYRIELAGTDEMQTVLSSTYSVGYRLGMIVTGAGALYLAAQLGTAKGNYNYSAWQYTYLAMAGTMLIGIITTLVIPEAVNRVRERVYQRQDYFRLVGVFACAVAGFVVSYTQLDAPISQLKQAYAIKDTLALFGLESVRFILSGMVAVGLGVVLVKLGVVNRQMAYETWVAPIADFFKRYGLKLALVMLLLIGFYRISDIVAGAISNIFYQDLNFTKEQIASAVKTFGVIFSLIGGFFGGLLAQRFNVMKLLFISAILASSTNLIFIGFVKSGQSIADVQVNVAGQNYSTQVDEVGYWSIKLPRQQLEQALQNGQGHLHISTQFAHQSAEQAVQIQYPYLHQQSTQKLQFLPISYDNQVSTEELKQPIIISGQFFERPAEQLDKEKGIQLQIDNEFYPAKLDKQGTFTASIEGEILQNAQNKQVNVLAVADDGTQWQASQTYQVMTETPALNISVQPLKLVDSSQTEVEIKGKVIQQYSVWWLYFAVLVDNLASGLATAAFIAFLSSLTSISFTAVQYALFSSLMTLTPKFLGGYSGTMVTHMGYPNFFLMTALIGVPILILIVWVARLLKQHHAQTTDSQHDGE